MFKRELQVKMVKPTKKDTEVTDVSESTDDNKTATIAYVVNKGIRDIGITVCAYVVLDTIRKYIVTAASRP